MSGVWLFGFEPVVASFVSDASLVDRLLLVRDGLFLIATTVALYLLVSSRIKQRAVAERPDPIIDHLFQTNRDGYLITSADGRIRDVNPAMTFMTGYSSDELKGRDASDIFASRSINEHEEECDRQLEERGFTDLFEIEITRKGGTVVPVEAQAYVLNRTDEDEEPLIASFIRDITARKSLREDRERGLLRVARYNEVLSTLIKDPDLAAGNFSKFLQTFTETISSAVDVGRVSVWTLHGTNAKPFIKCADIWDAKERTHTKDQILSSEVYPSYFAALLTDRTLVFDDVLKDDRTKEMAADYFPGNGIRSMLDAPFHLDGEIAGVLCLEHVDTDRKWRVEEETLAISSADILSIVFESLQRRELANTLHRSEKLDALGQLTGGVAHDFNNVLSVIIGYAEILETTVGNDPALANNAREILQAGRRGAKLTENLLSFSSRTGSNPSLVDINELLQQEKDMLQKTLTVRVQLIFDLEDELWPARIDYNDMEHAILNICINSMHAIEGGGQIEFKTRNESLDVPAGRKLNLAEGDYVTISVRDDGCGMTEDVANKIFEPFFSTKEDKGTGLGLSQVYGFIQRSGGAIGLQTAPGEGTLLKMYFPRSVDESVDAGQSAAETQDKLGGGEKILVVDDEPALSRLSATVLSTNGYEAITASSGRQALSILENDSSIDVLLTDLLMPEMDGAELAIAVAEKYPAVKIQLVSGFADDNRTDHLDQKLRDDLLIKPFESSALLERVRNLIDERG